MVDDQGRVYSRSDEGPATRRRELADGSTPIAIEGLGRDTLFNVACLPAPSAVALVTVPAYLGASGNPATESWSWPGSWSDISACSILGRGTLRRRNREGGRRSAGSEALEQRSDGCAGDLPVEPALELDTSRLG
jgi:hypothetical protein